jgi:secreted PhoX family phosphatase
MSMTRRTLIKGSAAGVLGAVALPGLVARAAKPTPRGGSGKVEGGYGELVVAGPELALPNGFRYVVLNRQGEPMTDGKPTPGVFDGMAAFAVGGKTRLVRNHEIRTSATASSVLGDPSKAYDPLAGGGTTTLELAFASDGTPRVTRSFVSIGGTHTNCAGGPTPWGSWITCEEVTVGRAQGFAQEHGYNFEVPTTAEGTIQAEPLKAMGRFVHEAIAVDPKTGIVYQTEDRNIRTDDPRPGSGFYRFIPAVPGNLRAGGKLQMLAIKGQTNYDTVFNQRMGKPLPVAWVDIADADPANPDGYRAGDGLAVYKQGYDQGGARFARLEGAWYADGSIFFHATNGGDAGLGQVWQYTPRGNSGGQLALLFESESADVLDAPDNVTVSPRGGIVICEDGDGTQYLRGLTQRGDIFDFARNLINEEDASEFAGACFSPDGRYLFVNIQSPGNTYAIWGPWEQGAL